MKRDEIQTIVKTSPVLQELRDSEEPLHQSEIRRRLDKSKSTTHRRMKKLEKMEFISGGDQGYSLTLLGETVARKTEEYVSEVSVADEYEEFLETVKEAELSLRDIADADVTRASSENPVAPLVRLAEITADASEVRVLTNSVAPESFKVGREKIREGEQEVEMVIDGRTIKSIRGNDWFGEELKRDLGTENLELWVHREPVPYQIGIMDDRLCLGAEDENRMPVALLETENESAVKWAQREFKSYRERAERLAASDV